MPLLIPRTPKEEFDNWKSQIVTSNWMSQNATSNSILKGARKCPYAFTENGIAMLSGLLNSSIAIHVNIQIMRAFVAMRHTILDKNQLFSRIENIEPVRIASENLPNNVLFVTFTRCFSRIEKPVCRI